MKPSDQVRAVAKAAGWRETDGRGIYWDSPEGIFSSSIPDFLSDRDAIIEVVKGLEMSEQMDFWWNLHEIVNGYKFDYRAASIPDCVACMTATAAQMREAYLKTIGKWIEEEA